MEVRELTRTEISPAMELVWRVFSEFEAPEYSGEGVETFRAFIQPDEIYKMLDAGEMLIFGAFMNGSLRGVLAEKGAGHISLFFVRKEFHRQGIGRALFEHYADACMKRQIARVTVNSSPYAVPVYRKLGFSDTDAEQLQNGIRYVPMEYYF
jgi:GNAT superfamily N-acetyltransferase